MIGTLIGSSESLVAVLSAAPATTQPTFSVVYKDKDGGVRTARGSLNGVTVQTLLAGVVAEGTKVIESVHIYNVDTAAVTATLSWVISGTTLDQAKVTIPVSGSLSWSKEAGVRVVDSSGQLLQSINTASSAAGVVANTATAVETGDIVRKTVLTLNDLPVTVGNTTGISFGGSKIYDFPAGRILILGVTVEDISFDLTDAGNVTPIDAADGGDIAIGTTAPDDGSLTDTDVDILPSTSIDPISDGVVGAALAASAQFDGTTDAVDAFFNIIIDDADVADTAEDVLLVNGTVTITWINLGDY